MTTTQDPMISADELAARLHEPSLRLLDCRFNLADPQAGRRAFDAGHLPGAFYCGLEPDLSAPVGPGTGRHPLPSPGDFVVTLRRLGVGRDSQVVAYDERDGMYAARLWWMLRWIGHADVRVLDGGLARWQTLGLPLTTEVPQAAVTPGDLVARPRPEMLVDAAEAGRLAASLDHRVLDARSPERYRGEVEPIDRVAGHVPGALNRPYARSLAEDGRLRDAGALRAELLDVLDGVPAAHATAMCGSGVTACHLLLALERAGLPGARLYAGSWSEWIVDPARPVARGAEP
jgi:thiosulfate/3-mercaptopyruvate sulfurtransferase